MITNLTSVYHVFRLGDLKHRIVKKKGAWRNGVNERHPFEKKQTKKTRRINERSLRINTCVPFYI